MAGTSWRFGPKMRPGSRFSGGRGGGGVHWAAGSGSVGRQVEPVGVELRPHDAQPGDLQRWP